MITITAEMTDDQAFALAQFLKRAGFSDYRANAVNDSEAYEMQDAAERVRDALAEQGFAPR